MKKIILLTVSILLFNICLCQKMESFFANYGVEKIANLAHPTNTFKSGSFLIENNRVWVEIYYEGYITELEISRDGNFFGDIRIIRDTDWVTPFIGAEFIKNVLLDLVEEDIDQEQLNAIEKLIGKALAYMNGEEMAIAILNLLWWSY